VDAMGGAARAIEQGFFQKQIADSAYALQKAVEAGNVVLVGVNRFTTDEPPSKIEIPDYAGLEARQKARLVEAKARRSAAAVQAALAALHQAAAGTAPVMPVIVEAVRVRATLGEISDVLRGAWGRYAA
jgi:methylmalonyl-CoA mutase N-terminal domain/subunit